MTQGLDCRETSRLISQGLDDAMPPPVRARLRDHFVICRSCRTVKAQMEFLRVAVKRLDKDPRTVS